MDGGQLSAIPIFSTVSTVGLLSPRSMRPICVRLILAKLARLSWDIFWLCLTSLMRAPTFEVKFSILLSKSVLTICKYCVRGGSFCPPLIGNKYP